MTNDQKLAAVQSAAMAMALSLAEAGIDEDSTLTGMAIGTVAAGLCEAGVWEPHPLACALVETLAVVAGMSPTDFVARVSMAIVEHGVKERDPSALKIGAKVEAMKQRASEPVRRHREQRELVPMRRRRR